MRLVPTIGLIALRPLLDLLTARDVPHHELYVRIGWLPPADASDDDDVRVPLHRLLSVWSHAEELLGDRDVGLHAAEHATFDSFRVLSSLAAAAPTLGQGLAFVVRYVTFVTGFPVYRLSSDGEIATLALLQQRWMPTLRQPAEMILGIPHLYCGRASTRPWSLIDVAFRHERPASTREHARIFGAPVSFREPEARIRFAATQLDTPSRFRDDAHASVLVATAEQLSCRAPAPDFVASTRLAVWELLQRGDLTLASVARAMGMSERTLQRELSRLGTSHRVLLDEVRAAYADQLLRTDAKLLEIALLLGFAEQTAFQRAYKKWRGRSPARARGDG